MPRAKDLDTIAPDDPIVVAPPSSPKPKKVKHLKKILPPKTSASSEFRQKVYQILDKSSHSHFSFLVQPESFSFEEKDDQEEIILVVRRHWLTNVTWVLITLAMLITPIIFHSVPLMSYFPATYQFIALIFWYLITFMYSFEQFLSWYFNVCIITDERVIDIDFNNLLIKKFTDAKISMIQDVTSRVIGVSQTLLNYGTVLIQTASEINELIFEKVPNPEKIIKVLQQLRQEEEQEAAEGRVN